MKVILDVTRANPGTELTVVTRVSAAHPGLDPTALIIFRLATQVPSSLGAEVVLPANTPPYMIANKVFEKLRELLAAPVPDRIEVFSFHKYVFDLRMHLAATHQSLVEFRAVKSLPLVFGHPPTATHISVVQQQSSLTMSESLSTSAVSTSPGSLVTPPTTMLAAAPIVAPNTTPVGPFTGPIAPVVKWPAEIMPVTEAIDVLAAALRDANALESTGAVRQTDLRGLLARVDRRLDKNATPASAVPGLMTALVRAAEDARRVKVDRTDATNPRVWVVATPSTLSSASEGRPMKSSRRHGQTRSQGFLDVLRSQHLGPFSQIRDILYESLEKQVKNGPLTVGELLKRTVDATRASVAAANMDAERYAWRGIREFLTVLLTKRPVLVSTSGTDVVPSFLTLKTQVGALREGWRLDLDGELLAALVAGGVDIRLTDVASLAGALYFERSDETEAEATAVIERSLATGRLMVADDGTLRLQLPLPSQEATTPLQPQ